MQGLRRMHSSGSCGIRSEFQSASDMGRCGFSRLENRQQLPTLGLLAAQGVLNPHRRCFAADGIPSRPPLVFCLPLRAACETAKATSREENAVFLAPEHRNEVRFRVGRRVRLEPEARLLRGPVNRGSCAQERTFELLRTIFNLCHRDGAFPFHVEGDRRADWEDPRDGRSGKP